MAAILYDYCRHIFSVNIPTAPGELASLTDEKSSSHIDKTESWYLIGVVFKIFDEHFRPFQVEVPPHIMIL